MAARAVYSPSAVPGQMSPCYFYQLLQRHWRAHACACEDILSLKTNLSLENQIHLIVDLQISENLPIIEEAPPK
jgi:hypothetical protein